MLIASSLMMLVLLVLLVTVEWRGEKHRKEIDARYSVQVEKLSDLTHKRYRTKFGKDPTMEVPIFKEVKKK